MSLHNSILYDEFYENNDGNGCRPIYTRIKINVTNNSTGMAGLRQGNWVYSNSEDVFQNHTGAPVTVTITIIQDSDKKDKDNSEHGYISYYFSDHDHSYDTYVSQSSTKHHACCDCGDYIEETHTIKATNSGVACSKCGYRIVNP